MEVGFGKTVRANDEGVVKERVHSIAFHPHLDIAIIILGAEVPLSQQVRMIGLPETGSDFTGQTATLAGPGILGEGKQPLWPEELFHKVSLRVGTGQENTTTNTGGQGCPMGTLCATSLRKEPWGSGCGGDSGSPLFICSPSSDACTLLAPIVGPPPYGEQKCDKGDSSGPSVAALRPWIDQIITP